MRLLLTALFYLAAPFWETTPPEQWTARQIEALRFDSPWAENIGPEPRILVYLATAAPIEEAEAEARLRAKNPLPDRDPDYLDYLRENRDRNFVLAVPYKRLDALKNREQVRRMEEQTLMIVGGQGHKITGHFPPTAEDPVLRLVFPRIIGPSDKSVVFHLYLPGVQFPERDAEFRVKDLSYHGRLAM